MVIPLISGHVTISTKDIFPAIIMYAHSRPLFYAMVWGVLFTNSMDERLPRTDFWSPTPTTTTTIQIIVYIPLFTWLLISEFLKIFCMGGEVFNHAFSLCPENDWDILPSNNYYFTRKWSFTRKSTTQHQCVGFTITDMIIIYEVNLTSNPDKNLPVDS